MEKTHLSRLRIERSGSALARRRGRWLKWLVLAALVVAGYFGYRHYEANAPVPVEIASIAQAHPSVAQTQLNATGYVVAQRKAAVASKATGRLEWLGVREGSVVKEGEEIGRAHV